MVFETKITKILAIKHPIIAAPMGPFYTTELTVVVSEAGGLGVITHQVKQKHPEIPLVGRSKAIESPF